MATAKENQRTARKLFTASMEDGKLNVDSVRKIVAKLSSEKPRGYLALINAYWRLVRLELEKSQALVESATPLTPELKKQVQADLEKKYGDQLNIEFTEDEELLGGMKIKVGSDVWDGTVKNRLERLSGKIG